MADALAKQVDPACIVGTAQLVEIELLRGGEPLPAPDRPDYDDSALVSRAETRPEAEYWPIRLREPLPVVPIPLRGPDRDATLDLQSLLHAVYDAGRYGRYAYESRPNPPLRPADDAWASALLADGTGSS
jgi:hypothetical protein